MLAQALEHEVDHLNGILYIDHINRLEHPDHFYKLKPEDATQVEAGKESHAI